MVWMTCTLFAVPTFGGLGLLCAGGNGAETSIVSYPIYFMPLAKDSFGNWKDWIDTGNRGEPKIVGFKKTINLKF